jgi:hypothetical protein
VRINPAVHTYAVDGASAGVTTDFPPTVIAQTTPVAPLHRFLRNALALAIAAGSSRQSVDATVDGSVACPARPFVPFGTWATNLP